MSLHFLGSIAFFLPSGSDCFPLSPELNCTLSIEIASAPHAHLVSCEGEHWKRNRDWKIDTDLSTFNFVLELSSSVSVLCEDSNSVTVLICINHINGFLCGVSSDNAHNRSENFFIVAFHAWFNIINNGRTDKVTFFKSLNFVSSSI